jgi:hypothetical protein
MNTTQENLIWCATLLEEVSLISSSRMREMCGFNINQQRENRKRWRKENPDLLEQIRIINQAEFVPVEQLNYDKVDSDNAEIAYNAYAKAASWLTYDNKPMPVWNGTELATLPDNIKSRWFEAARAIREASYLPF